MPRTAEEIFEFCSAPYLKGPTRVAPNFSRVMKRGSSTRVAKRASMDAIATVWNRSTAAWSPGKVLCSMPPPAAFMEQIADDPGVAIIVSGKGTLSTVSRHRLPGMILKSASRSLLEAISENKDPSSLEDLPRTLREYRHTLARSQIRALMLSANYSPGLRLLALAAKDEGISVVLYPHGMLGNPERTVQVDHGMTDHWFAWTDGERKRIIREGVPANQVRFIGPYRDIPRCKRMHQESVRSVLFLGTRGDSWTDGGGSKAVWEIASACERKGIDFTFRPHPAQKLQQSTYDNFLRTKMRDTASLYTDVCRSDLVVGFLSTSLLESKMAGRFTVCIIKDGDATPPLHAEDICHQVSPVGQFCSILDQMGANLGRLAAESGKPLVMPHLLKEGLLEMG